jgi:hypothetical protein
MILSKRQRHRPLAACLTHNPIEFKDARLIDGVNIDRNDRLGQELAFQKQFGQGVFNPLLNGAL